MTTTLRKNWLKLLMVSICVVSVYYYVFLQYKYLYPIYLVVGWALNWWIMGRISLNAGTYNSTEFYKDNFVLLISLGAALSMSNSLVKENYIAALVVLMPGAAIALFGNSIGKTNWQFLIKLIIATLIFIACFFALIILNSI